MKTWKCEGCGDGNPCELQYDGHDDCAKQPDRCPFQDTPSTLVKWVNSPNNRLKVDGLSPTRGRMPDLDRT